MAEPGQSRPRPGQVDADPSTRLDEVLHLLDELTETVKLSDGLLRTIEYVTGLRVSEIQMLRAITPSGATVQDVAGRVGQTEDAANATVDGLVARGLVQREQRAGPAGVVRVTEAGAAALAQTQGVQIRLLDTLVAEIGAEGVRALRTTLHGLTGVLRTLARHTGAGSARQLAE